MTYSSISSKSFNRSSIRSLISMNLFCGCPRNSPLNGRSRQKISTSRIFAKVSTSFTALQYTVNCFKAGRNSAVCWISNGSSFFNCLKIRELSKSERLRYSKCPVLSILPTIFTNSLVAIGLISDFVIFNFLFLKDKQIV